MLGVLFLRKRWEWGGSKEVVVEKEEEEGKKRRRLNKEKKAWRRNPPLVKPQATDRWKGMVLDPN